MDQIFKDFRNAYEQGHGYNLSLTLLPIAPPSQLDRLHSFFRSTNHSRVKADFVARIFNNSTQFQLPKEEGNGWVDVYCAYWKAVGEILDAEAALMSDKTVSGDLSYLGLWLNLEILIQS
jgi:hypothetical protein